MIVTILLGVVTLAVLVLAFLATKFWHWAHVLVLVAFYFASVGYALLAARSLDTRLKFQKQEATATAEIEKQELLNDGLRRGSSDPSIVNQLAARDVLAAQDADTLEGTVQLEHQLRMKSRMRGRVWRDARPTGPVDPQTGMVTVGFPVRREAAATPEDEALGEEAADEAAEPVGPPPALGMEPDSIVYVFEQGPMEGRGEGQPPNHYIGEFRVEAVSGREAKFSPLDQLALDPVAAERLLSSRGPWIVYETMPADDRDLFTGLDEETLRRLLPEGVVEEYLRDGTPATPDDPPERLVDVDADGNIVPPDSENEAVAKRYRRRLRDYTLLLNGLEADRALLVAREQALTSDIAKLNSALKGAEELQAYRQAEIAKWRADLTAIERERKAIEAHAGALQQQIANARRLLDQTLQQNAQLASARASERGVLAPFGPGALDIDAL